MPKILIEVSGEKFEGELDKDLAPDTVRKILKALPIEAAANTWGDEIYFPIPVHMQAENVVETVSVGDLAYWPQGEAFCIFYGKTPMSQSEEEIVPASPVNPIGTVQKPEGLKKHGPGDPVRIELLPD
ncbi:MAG: cyclophilin-like fold protein [Candidatus Brocadiia bacterium]|nr:DUF3830 family protein [Planctomycetota bacterium]